MAKHEEYFDKLKECTSNLLVLDDELVLGSRFYENKSARLRDKLIKERNLKTSITELTE